MRTTITLDHDVEIRVKRACLARGLKFKDIVNRALREGLAEFEKKPRKTGKYATSSVSLGPCLIGDLDNTAEALALAEGENFR